MAMTAQRPGGRLARRCLLVTGMLLGLAPVSPAFAQVKGMEIMAPAGPGGGYDQLARAMQQVLEGERLATGVQVVNVPGAGGTIGLAQFTTAKKRGSNAMVAGLGLVGAVLTNKSPVSLADLAPLARLIGEYEVFVTAASSPLITLGDLVRKFKAEPGSVSWGGFALGSPDHIVAGLVAKAVGVPPAKLNYIVAGAGGEMLAQVMGGHITVGIGGYNEFAQQVARGQLRVLGISSPNRLPGLDIPTFKEQGVDVELVNWRGMIMSPNLQGANKAALEEAIGKAVQSAAWKQLVNERGWVDLYMPSAEFGPFLTAERSRVEAILRDTGLLN